VDGVKNARAPYDQAQHIGGRFSFSEAPPSGAKVHHRVALYNSN
jgi:hypothetical protein